MSRPRRLERGSDRREETPAIAAAYLVNPRQHEIADNTRDLSLFDLAIDSKLRRCDLVALRVNDVFAAGHVKARPSMIQSKTCMPVLFEITEAPPQPLDLWVRNLEIIGVEFLYPSRIHGSAPDLSTRQYARIVRGWVTPLGLELSAWMSCSSRKCWTNGLSKATRLRCS